MPTLNPNLKKLQNWMNERDITIRSLAERLQVSKGTMSQLLRSKTIPVRRHTALLHLGFPDELLPAPLDRKTGPQPKTPQFPTDKNH